MGSFAACAAAAQDKPPSVVAGAVEKQIKFDVVSVKPSRAGENWHFGFGADGFSAAGRSLTSLIYLAYFPMNMSPKVAIVGAPGWADKDLWDIEAKVAPEDVAYYQAHRPRFDDGADSVGKLLLQSMLAERFHLTVHTVPAEMDGYALVVAKSGPKMKEAAADEAQPSGSISMPGGGYMIPAERHKLARGEFHAVTMSAFAIHLRGNGVPVVDRTGLDAKYDFTLNWVPSGDPEEKVGFIEFDDPDKLSHYDFDSLGLRAQHVKLPTVQIVVDHVERPEAN